MMSDLAQIGLVRTTGFTSWLTRLVTRSHWNHTICRVSEHNVVSAQPDGVQIMHITDFPDVVWSDFPLTERQQTKIIAFSLVQVGRPYGTFTYIWIGISKITRWATPRWLERRLSDQHTWVCSQVCDAAYQAAGIHLFGDDRPAGSVVPGDLAKLFVDFGWTDKP